MSVPDDRLAESAAATPTADTLHQRPSQFTVWLRHGLHPPDEALLLNVASKINSKDGSYRLCLRCASLDTSHPYYFEADCFHPTGEAGLVSIKLPHQLVFLILGDDPQRPLGFAVD